MHLHSLSAVLAALTGCSSFASLFALALVLPCLPLQPSPFGCTGPSALHCLSPCCTSLPAPCCQTPAPGCLSFGSFLPRSFLFSFCTSPALLCQPPSPPLTSTHPDIHSLLLCTLLHMCPLFSSYFFLVPSVFRLRRCCPARCAPPPPPCCSCAPVSSLIVPFASLHLQAAPDLIQPPDSLLT
eukprot:m.636312 g.636312  ORF g.636312 m.636312 type:complete len:183 (+) comp58306_c0_seq27:554-1102(+)